MNATGTGAAFHARSAWAQWTTTTLIYCGILVGTLPHPMDEKRTARILGAAVLAEILALALLHAVFAVTTDAEPDDERDLAIRLQSTQSSGVLLAGGVVLAIAVLLIQESVALGGGTPALLSSPLLAVQVLLFGFTASELVRLWITARSYARGV